MSGGWLQSDEVLHPPTQGLVSRNLHWFIAAGLGAVVLIGFAIQGSMKAHVNAQTPSSAEDNPVVLGREPALNSLHEVLVHQQEHTPSKPGKSESDPEAEMARIRRLEAEKQQAVVAGSPMLAINRSTAPVTALNAPSTTTPRFIANASSAIANRLPAGIALPAGLANPNTTPKLDPAAEASARAARAVIPLTPIKPANPRQVLEGSLIPAVLLTQISSDLPGMITAQVTEDVYDSIHGNYLAIPKGSRVIGEYGSHVLSGQERIMASFHRLILPNGESFILDTPQAADPGGQAGMKDEVDDRFWKRLGGQFMTAGLARIVEQPQGGVTILGGAGNTLAGDAAGQILVDTARVGFQGNAALGPIIVIKRGYPFVILVNRDMDFSTLTRRP